MYASIKMLDNLSARLERMDTHGANAFQLEEIDRAPGSGISGDLAAHHQGCFKLDGDENYIISGSIKNTDVHSTDRPYFYVIRDGKGSGCVEGKDYFPITHDAYPLGIDPDDHRQFTHAGGIQVAESVLAIGLEDYYDSNLEIKNNQSIIRFYDLSNEKAISEIGGWSFRRDGDGKIASAIGLTKWNQRWLLAVRSDGYVDFYTSDDEAVGAKPFRFIKTIHKNDENRLKAFQTLNLFPGTDDNVYMFGMPDGDSTDDKCWLHKLSLCLDDEDNIADVSLEYLCDQHFYRKGEGPRFHYAACANVTEDHGLCMYSMEAHVSDIEIDKVKTKGIRCNRWDEKKAGEQL